MRQLIAGRRGALLLFTLSAALASCSAKETEFFTFVDQGRGEIVAFVDGTPAGATVRLVGEGIDVSGLADEEGHVFSGLPEGAYTLTVTPPQGMSCVPTSVQVTLGGATLDGEAFFDCIPMPGSINFTLTGVSASTLFPLTLSGAGNLSGQLGLAGLEFGQAVPGTWNWMLGSSDDYTCLPGEGSFTLEPGGSYSQAISCAANTGGLSVTVLGATAMVSFSGPESGSSSVGGSPVSFDDLTPGTYTVSVSSPDGFTCLPSSSQVTVTAGEVTQVVFECEALTGTITATVAGATAQVNYSGAASGGGAVGSTPVAFNDLPSGSYTVVVESPDGFTCEPESIAVTLDPGETETVAFTCEAEPAEEAVEYDVDLGGLQAPGVVAAGIYQRAVLNAALVAVATMNLRAFGGNTFYGTSPDRIGFGGSSGWEIDALFPVAALVFRIQVLRLCALNATLSASNFITIGHYNAALVLLASNQITATGCFNYPVPDGARYIRLSGPGVGFADINLIRLIGLLVPPP